MAVLLGALESRLREQARLAGRDDLQVLRYRWSPWSDNLRRAGPNGAHVGAGSADVQMTFLDPIGLRGLFERGWGAGEFGRCADAAVAYINSDDPAPATDRVLRHARTVDVTMAPGRGSFDDGHRWPVQYYLDRAAGGEGPPAVAR